MPVVLVLLLRVTIALVLVSILVRIQVSWHPGGPNFKRCEFYTIPISKMPALPGFDLGCELYPLKLLENV